MTHICIPQIAITHHGGTKILIDLANYLVQDPTLKVTFLVPAGHISTNYEISEDVILKETVSPFNNKFLSYFFFLLLLPFRLKVYDVVIANFFVTYFPALISTKIFNKKIFYFVQDIENKYRSKFVGRILNTVCDLSYKSTNIISANDYLTKKLFNLGCKPMLAINIGLDKPFFETPLINKQRENEILYMARKESWKRLEDFIRFLALQKKPLKILMITQDLKLIDRIKDDADKSIHAIKFFTPKSREELIAAYDSSKFFISTSIKEGFSLPPLEAMSRRTIPIIYPSGGPQLYINDKANGFFFKTVEELDSIFNQKLESYSDLSDISQNAFDTAQTFKLETSLKQIKNLIEK